MRARLDLFWWIPIGIAFGVIACAAAIRLNLTYPCPFNVLFDMPCPTCGGTRAFAALARLELIQAFLFNPLLVLIALGSLAAAVFREKVFGWAGKISLPVIAGAVLVNWVYLILFLPR